MKLRRSTFPRIRVREHRKGGSQVTQSRVKAGTYRLLIVGLDFLVIYLLTRQLAVCFGFLVVSNLYTAAAHVVHERIWDRIARHVSASRPRAA